MSKHIDLIAIGFLLIAFAFGAQFQNALQSGIRQGRFLELRQMRPVIAVPPCMPALQHLARLPRLHS